MTKSVGLRTTEPETHVAPHDPVVLRERVFAEAQRFRLELPTLLLTLADRWVVFRDGAVVSAHDSHEEAYVAGLHSFGPHGGFVVGLVREPEILDDPDVPWL